MKKFISLLFLNLTLSSCGNYQNVSSQPRITHILAVNELGQQVQVPLSSFSNQLDPYYYNNWRFYWGNNWYYGNNWWFYFDDPYWRPRIHNYYYSHFLVDTPTISSSIKLLYFDYQIWIVSLLL